MSNNSKKAYYNLLSDGELCRSQLAVIGALWILGNNKTIEEIARFMKVKDNVISGRFSGTPGSGELVDRGIVIRTGRKNCIKNGKNYPMTRYSLASRGIDIYQDGEKIPPREKIIIDADKIFKK